MAVTLNASTSSGFIQTADTSGDLALQSNGTTQFNVSSTGAYGQVKSGTAVAASSGTAVLFTSIPSWVKRITVMFNEVSLSGTDSILVQLGDAGGLETTGYVASSTGTTGASGSTSSSTSGFIVASTLASYINSGALVLTLMGSNLWIASGSGKLATNTSWFGGGSKTLSDTLTQLNITVTGANTFDGAGTVNILYEG
jgi:hypothetical protein